MSDLGLRGPWGRRELLHRVSGTRTGLSAANTVRCPSFRRRPGEEDTPDVGQRAKPHRPGQGRRHARAQAGGTGVKGGQEVGRGKTVSMQVAPRGFLFDPPEKPPE